MAFKKATKESATIKLAITGPSGSGKTYSALLLAKGLGGKTALLDTEYGSASLYADQFDFDTWDDADPNGFPPEYFIRVIKAAEEAGYNNLIIDSLSHEWSGRGGCLEIVDTLSRGKYRGNSYVAWGEVTPRHARLIEAIVSAKINIIATMRAKTEYILNKDEKTGKSTPQKVGLGSVQRDGVDYEFTIMFELDRDSHIASAGKDRTSMFYTPCIISEETGQRIKSWLTDPKPVEPPKTTETQKPVEQPKKETKKRDPLPFLLQDLTKRMEAGETKDSILKSYADILKTDDIRSPEKLSDVEKSTLANFIYKQNKEKENV